MERVIAYFSKTLERSERNYCVTRKQLLAIVKSVEHFHHYQYRRKFLIRTDHAALRWLLSFKNPEEQVACWIKRLQQYNFEIKHREWKMNGNADVFSERPCEAQCKQWSQLEEKQKKIRLYVKDYLWNHMCRRLAKSLKRGRRNRFSPTEENWRCKTYLVGNFCLSTNY